MAYFRTGFKYKISFFRYSIKSCLHLKYAIYNKEDFLIKKKGEIMKKGLYFTYLFVGTTMLAFSATAQELLMEQTTMPQIAPAQVPKGAVDTKIEKGRDTLPAVQTPVDQKIDESKEKAVLQTNMPKSVKQRQEHARQRHALAKQESFAQKYADFKQDLNNKMGLSYSLDISIMGQRGAPNGKGTPWQTQYYGSVDWNMYKSKIGDGSLQFAYTDIHYWGKSGAWLNNRLALASELNDYTSNEHYFDQLTYTHTLPGDFSWLSVSFGQFPMYNWDGTEYDSNQQTNFINMALSQNASSTYPSASLGGFVTVTPNSNWQFAAGFQDANNTTGSKIDTHTFHEKKFTSFVSASFTPTIKDLGAGQYSILLYNQPGVEEQPGTTNGWSINVAQSFGEKWALFGRVNGNTGVEPIKQSYVLGTVYNNPLNRNALDQIGFAAAINKLNKNVNGSGTRSVETVLEAYWAWGLSNFVTITPDVQFYINPGLDSDKNTATVASIRATFMF